MNGSGKQLTQDGVDRAPSTSGGVVSAWRSRFLRDCTALGLWRGLRFGLSVLELRLFAAPRWAPDTPLASLDASERWLLACIGALADLVPRGAAPTFSARHEATALVYGAVVLADAWIDSSYGDIAAKRRFASHLVRSLSEGLPDEAALACTDPASRSVLSRCLLATTSARDRFHLQPGWDYALRSLDTLLDAGYQEFGAQDIDASLIACEAVGAASAQVLLSLAYLHDPALQGPLLGSARAVGAMLNVIDDIFDWEQDLIAGCPTFVTLAPSVLEGQELGYRRCVELFHEATATADRSQLRFIRQGLGGWWLRNALRNGEVSWADLRKVLSGPGSQL